MATAAASMRSRSCSDSRVRFLRYRRVHDKRRTIKSPDRIAVEALITAGGASWSRYICDLRQAWNSATSLTTTPYGSSAVIFL